MSTETRNDFAKRTIDKVFKRNWWWHFRMLTRNVFRFHFAETIIVMVMAIGIMSVFDRMPWRFWWSPWLGSVVTYYLFEYRRYKKTGKY